MWLLATGNPHKVREIGEVLAPLGIGLVRPRGEGIELDPDEWGDTFAANAVIKALEFARHTHRVCLADDSGLEVEALGWRPGVYSARYAGDACDDAANNRKLLRELADVEDGRRGARYRCVIAAAFPLELVPEHLRAEAADRDDDAPEEARIVEFGANDERVVGGHLVVTRDGVCAGAIGHEARGDGGFGYDPYFVLPDGRHMAELPSDEKHAISHRGGALQKVVAWLREHPELVRNSAPGACSEGFRR